MLHLECLCKRIGLGQVATFYCMTMYKWHCAQPVQLQYCPYNQCFFVFLSPNSNLERLHSRWTRKRHPFLCLCFSFASNQNMGLSFHICCISVPVTRQLNVFMLFCEDIKLFMFESFLWDEESFTSFGPIAVVAWDTVSDTEHLYLKIFGSDISL